MWIELLEKNCRSAEALLRFLNDLQHEYTQVVTSPDKFPEFARCHAALWLAVDHGFRLDLWRQRVTAASDIVRIRKDQLLGALKAEDAQRISVSITMLRSIAPEFRDNILIDLPKEVNREICPLYRLLGAVKDDAQSFINTRSAMGYDSSLSSIASELREGNPWRT